MTAPSRSRRHRLLCLLCPLLLILGVPAAHAADPAETRDFLVLIDGKQAGSYQLSVTPNGGKTLVAESARVRIRFGLYTYTYKFDGSEVWDGAHLERLEATSVEGSKRTVVAAVMQGDRATITVNGRGRQDLACPWSTTHWRLPPPGLLDRPLAILDVDTGKRVEGRLHLIETVRLQLAGQVRTCKHYRVTGGDQAEVWYDDTDRLVRQQTVEDGHRTELRLTGLRQNAP